jgi:aspartate kinase
MKKLIVQKFGGSSLATPAQIKKIAAKIADQHRSGFQVIVVVSAMGKTTDGLMNLAHEVSAVPNRRELDMLLSTGERISMALLSMALHDLSCPSISFTGSQAGVMTDGSHSNAVIKELKPIRVQEALDQNKVVVLAGFQGVDPITKEITTLGRGGSDTTAVAMAAYFKAERCEILKDVDGVFSADPRLVPEAQLIGEVPGGALVEMCRWGAKVLHYRSVETAVQSHVPLGIGRSDTFVVGTRVTYDAPTLASSVSSAASNSSQLLAVNSIQDIQQLTIEATSATEAVQVFQRELDKNKLPYPEILDNENVGGIFKLTYCSDLDTLNAIRKTFALSTIINVLETHISSVTVTAHSALSADTTQQLQSVLKVGGIQCKKFLTTNQSLSFFVAQDLRVKTIQLLYTHVNQSKRDE